MLLEYGMISPMRGYLFVFVYFISGAVVAMDTSWTLSAEQWARPRSGATVAAMMPLAEVVAMLGSTEEGRLLIRHADDEAGGLWAYELRSWLVALGIPAQRIQLMTGGGSDATLELQIHDRTSP